MASNARNLSKLLGTSTQVPTTALPPAIADLETVGQTLSGGEIAPSSIKSNTLTQSFDSNQAVAFNMADSIDAVSPIVSVFKEVPQQGFSSKGQWDVNANATNYEFFDEKPISYSSANLTPSATGDGTFTNSSAIVTPYMLSNLSYDSKSLTASSQQGGAQGMAISTDGTSVYTIGYTNDTVYQYTLTTAFDLSTASYANKSFSVASQDAVPRDIRFKPDGTIMYVIASTAPDSVYQYTLSTAWDVSTASYANKSLNVQSQSANPAALVLSPDGTKVYIGGYNNKTVFQYNLSAAWDLSTGTYSNNSFATTNDFNYSHSALELNSDASKLFVGRDGYEIAEYNMPSDGNVSNASYVATYDVRNTTVGSKNIGGMAFGNNGAKFYIYGNNDNNIYQFSSTASLAFNAADVGKKVVGNSGSAIITGTSGTYKSVTPFADTSAISSWQLFGAEGKADGSGISLTVSGAGSFDISGASDTGRTGEMSPIIKTMAGVYASSYTKGAYMKPDGTQFFIQYGGSQNLGRYIYSIPLTTAYDISTATSTGAVQGNVNTDPNMVQYGGIFFKSDGTSLYFTDTDYTNSAILQYNMSTPWAVNTMSFGTKKLVTNAFLRVPSGIFFSQDGTKMFLSTKNYNISGNGAPHLVRMTLSTPWDLSTAGSSPDTNQTLDMTNLVSTGNAEFVGAGQINSDGTKIVFHNSLVTAPPMFVKLELSTAYDLTTATVTENTPAGGTGGGNATFVTENGLKAYVQSGSSSQNFFHEYNIGEAASINYNSYSPALTNSSTGQINSSSWLDINSMTADETKNGGDIFYAVSTDNRTSWAVAKASDGVRKIAKNNSGTWQYNNDGGAPSVITNNISLIGDANTNSGSYNSISGQQTPGGNTVHKPNWISPDGTKLYVMNNESGTSSSNYTNSKVWEYSMSTAYDLSTASATGATENINFWDGQSPHAIAFNPEGTKLWITGGTTNSYTYRFNLSTAWDLSTSVQVDGSENNNNNSRAGRLLNSGTVGTLKFNSDGSKVYSSNNATTIFRYSTSSAYHINGDLTSDQSVDLSTLGSGLSANLGSWEFNSNGTKLYAIDLRIDEPGIFVFNLSTAYDLSTLTYDATVSVASYGWEGSADTWMHGIHIRDNDQRLYLWFGEYGGSYIHSLERKWTEWTIGNSEFIYSTSETWVNGTNNNEHATLQEALGAQSFNRMNKAQLDAVADAYHFSQDSADTLDLMIAPYAASGTSPISDGVTINYDAEALIREAIPGTDYIAEFPNPNTLNITAVGAANLKIRAQ